MTKIIALIKSRILDIALVAIILGVFFVSGNKDEPRNREASQDTAPISSPVTQASPTVRTDLLSPPPAIAPANPAREAQYMVQAIASPYAAESPLMQPSTFPSISYKTELDPALRPAENLQESFRALEGGSVSTQAIIERNTYFRKLSEQLKDLQGDVSTESTSSQPTGREVNLPGQNVPVPGDPLQPEVLSDEELLNDPAALDELYDQIEQYE